MDTEEAALLQPVMGMEEIKDMGEAKVAEIVATAVQVDTDQVLVDHQVDMVDKEEVVKVDMVVAKEATEEVALAMEEVAAGMEVMVEDMAQAVTMEDMVAAALLIEEGVAEVDMKVGEEVEEVMVAVVETAVEDLEVRFSSNKSR